MTAAPRSCGAALLLSLLAVAGCGALSSERRREPSRDFLARQYMTRGRVAWAAGNVENARFLLGRAVELDPANEDALALWQSHWPLDSLPPAAGAARAAVTAPDSGRGDLASGASDSRAGGQGEKVATAPTHSPDLPSYAGDGTPAPAAGTAAQPGSAADAAAPSGFGAVPGSGAAPGRTDDPSRDPAAGEGAPVSEGATASGATPAEPLGPSAILGQPPPPIDPATLAAAAEARARFQAAVSSGDRSSIAQTGRELIGVLPHALPDLYAVLSTWVGLRVDPASTESRVRDVLGGLEYGDASYLAGKPEDVTDAAYLRGYRGRFLDLLGWSAFLRDDLAQAEAALRSAEGEINLRGRGDVSHLRHLSAFYERKGNLAKAESYAIAAAARDTSGSGEVQASAARLWTQRHGSRVGLEPRLAEEARRVRNEERGAAIANRLYRPLPIFRARQADGIEITDTSLRGRVSVIVLWRPDCADCLRLLTDLAANPPGATGDASTRKAAPIEVMALDVGPGENGEAQPPAGIAARPDNPRGLANALGAGRLPVTIVVEPAGFIQYRTAGYPADEVARRRWLERLRWQAESLTELQAEPGPKR